MSTVHNFITILNKKILDFGNDEVIICGNWNLVIYPEIDTENYRHANNPTARREVSKVIENDNYIDIYRCINESKGFIWRRHNPDKNKLI